MKRCFSEQQIILPPLSLIGHSKSVVLITTFESCYPQASTLMKVYARRYEARLKKEARAPSPSHRAPLHAKPTQSPQPNGNASFSLLQLLQQILQTLSEWLNYPSSRSEPRANKRTVTTSHLFNAASSSATPSQERAHAPVSSGSKVL